MNRQLPPDSQQNPLARTARKIAAAIVAAAAVVLFVTVVVPVLAVIALVTMGLGLLVFSVIAIFAYVKFRSFRKRYEASREEGTTRPGSRKVKSTVRTETEKDSDS